MSDKTTAPKPQVVFFGSGPVAARSLELLQKHANIEAVITKPSTAAEMRQACPDVEQHLVSSKAELDALVAEKPFTSPVGVLIDFGIIVSQAVIDSFPKGVINSHFSILPEWRGADPITFAVLSGQDMTGVSLMLLVQKMDEGPILSYGEQPLDGSETTPILTEKLISLSDTLLRHDLPRYLNGEIPGNVGQDFVAKQANKQVSYSRKLTKLDGKIDWRKPATQIEREIRAFSGWPKSYTTLAGKDVVITSASVTDRSGAPGTVLVDSNTLYIFCGEQALQIHRLKPAGKTEMPVEAFLAGYKSKL